MHPACKNCLKPCGLAGQEAAYDVDGGTLCESCMSLMEPEHKARVNSAMYEARMDRLNRTRKTAL